MSMNVTNILVKTDRFCDCLPIVSSFTNIVDLIGKAVLKCNPECVKRSHYYQHLDEKSILRCMVLIFLPVIGNILFGIYDCNRKTKTIETGEKERALDMLPSARKLKVPRKPETTTFQDISKEELLKLQTQIQNTNPKYPILNLSTLEDFFCPRHEMTIGEATYYCSNPFHYKGRPMLLVLVQIEDKVYPRVAYLSQSQGIWRVMPAATKGEFGIGFGRLGKGLTETDTQLPLTLNLALLQLPLPTSSRSALLESLSMISTFSPENLVRTGYDITDSYRAEVHQLPCGELEEGAKAWFHQRGFITPRPPDPKSITIKNSELYPDFSSKIEERMITIPQYGQVLARVFESRNKKLHYLFYEAADGRAFLSGVESVGVPINHYGVRTTFPDLKNLDAPLLEYRDQIPGEYQAKKEDASIYQCTDTRTYRNAWNYVRELAVIQSYYIERGLPVPESV